MDIGLSFMRIQVTWQMILMAGPALRYFTFHLRGCYIEEPHRLLPTFSSLP